MALALLRDINGDIGLSIPVSGNKEGTQIGFGQIVLFTHDRGSDETLELLASAVIAQL